MSSDPARTRIRALAIALFVLVVAHDVTHIADPGLKTPLGALAIVSVPQYAGLIWLLSVILGPDARRAAKAGLAMGAAVGLGFIVAHVLPFGPYPYWDRDPSTISWLAVWIPTGLSLALVVASALPLRIPARLASQTGRP